MRWYLPLFVLVLFGAAGARAIEQPLAPRAVSEAVEIGQSRIAQVRDRFHQPYRVPVGRPPLDYVEVVTPFRRVVLAAESRAALGDRRFGQREALALLDTVPSQVDVIVEMTFHPHNTFIGVPGYLVRLREVGAAATAVDPLGLDRIPRFGPRLDGVPLPAFGSAGAAAPPGGMPLTGGTIVARFDATRIAGGPYELLVLEGETALVTVPMNLRALR